MSGCISECGRFSGLGLFVVAQLLLTLHYQQAPSVPLFALFAFLQPFSALLVRIRQTEEEIVRLSRLFVCQLLDFSHTAVVVCLLLFFC